MTRGVSDDGLKHKRYIIFDINSGDTYLSEVLPEKATKIENDSINIFPYFKKSLKTVTKTNIDTLKATIQRYRFDNLELPGSLQELLQPNENNSDEPYIEDSDILLDPWGNEFIYIREQSELNESFEIKSLGSDNAEGGEGDAADISSKDLNKEK